MKRRDGDEQQRQKEQEKWDLVRDKRLKNKKTEKQRNEKCEWEKEGRKTEAETGKAKEGVRMKRGWKGKENEDRRKTGK